MGAHWVSMPLVECALTASIYVWIESVWRESGHLTFLWTMKKPDLTVVSALLVYTGFNVFPLLPGQHFLGQLNLNKISSRFSLAYSVRCDVVVMWIADCVHFGLLQCAAVCGRWPWVFVSSLPPLHFLFIPFVGLTVWKLFFQVCKIWEILMWHWIKILCNKLVVKVFFISRALILRFALKISSAKGNGCLPQLLFLVCTYS